MDVLPFIHLKRNENIHGVLFSQTDNKKITVLNPLLSNGMIIIETREFFNVSFTNPEFTTNI